MIWYKFHNNLHNSIRNEYQNKEEIMEENQFSQKLDILSKIYEARQYDFEKLASVERKEIKDKLNDVTIEELQAVIEANISEKNKCREIEEKLEQLTENYEIKMAFYMEKRYKQGFKDGICLLKQCEK